MIETKTTPEKIKNIFIQPYIPLVVCMVFMIVTCIIHTCKFNIPGSISPFSIVRPIAATTTSLLIIAAYRFSKIKLFPSTKNSWYIVIVAVLLNIGLNSEQRDNFWILFPATVTTSSLIYLSFSISKYLGCIIWFCILLTTYVQAVLILHLGLTLNTQLLTQILAASTNEVCNFLTLKNIILILLGVSIAFIGSFFIFHPIKRERKTCLFAQGIFHLTITIFFLYFSHSGIYNNRAGVMWPVSELRSILSNSISANEANTNFLNMVYELPSSSINTNATIRIDSYSDLVCILHIGESVRSDRLSINSYQRNTTPNMKKLQMRGSLINFPDCISSNWLTLSAITNILTDSETYHYLDPHKNRPSSGAITNALASHFFKCYYIIEEGSVQNVKEDSVFFSMMYGLSKKHAEYIRTKEPSINQISKVSEIINNSANRNTLIVLNNSGSHMPFHMYNQNNPPFSPTDAHAFVRNPMKNKTDEKLANNAYDNTIHYTDNYIYRVIQLLQGKPYIYIYVGDHGEYIGHDGKWNRGGIESITEYHNTSGCLVPFFIIYSQEFISLHPHFEHAIRNLKKNQAVTTSHSNIFHTLLGLFGIQSPLYNAEKDLSRQIN